uniref:TIL domain-containing protein n=1 Tax=Ditylenchus dipsaci TaxID=166011 RepID=A0A915CSI7_9BILA
MVNLTRIYWLKTLLLLLVNVIADRSQKDCQNNEVYIYCGSCEGTCREPVIGNCKKDCRPARCECRSRSGFVRAHDGSCIYVSECGTYRNPYSGSSSISPVINKSPLPLPPRNSNQPPFSSSGLGFPSSSTGQITGNGMGDSTAFQSHIQGAPPSASPLLPAALTDGRDQPRQPLFADPPQVAPEEWHHQQLTAAMPPSQRPEQRHLLHQTLGTLAGIALLHQLLPNCPRNIFGNNRNGWSVSDPPSSFTPEPSENNNNNGGWAANTNAGLRDQQSYKTPGNEADNYQSYPSTPPKAPSARSYGASSRQSLPFSQTSPQQSEPRPPSALPAIDALSVTCVDKNCAGFAAPKPVVRPETRQIEQPQPQQQQPKRHKIPRARIISHICLHTSVIHPATVQQR